MKLTVTVAHILFLLTFMTYLFRSSKYRFEWMASSVRGLYPVVYVVSSAYRSRIARSVLF